MALPARNVFTQLAMQQDADEVASSIIDAMKA
jgi:hypothetical protein